MDQKKIDAHLDAVLRAAGSALRHYSLQKSLEDMRAAMKAALEDAEPVNARLLAIAHQTAGIIENTSIETGYCCCGDGMHGHASPMICGHSATDQGAYLAGLLYEDAKAAIAAAEAQKAGSDAGLTLEKSDVEFLAARVRRLLEKFGVHEPEKDDRFIVGVAGSLIGNLLTNIELKEKSGPVRLAAEQIDGMLMAHGKGDDGFRSFARAIEVATLRANGLPVEN